MAEINARDVKALRDATGAGMMDCKKALAEAGGDLDAAKRILREKGLADAAKRTERATSEGIVYAYLHQPQPNYPAKLAVLLELNCETDVVDKIVAGKLEAFYKANVLLEQEWIQDKSKSIAALIDDAKAAMSENISIGRFCRIR